MKDFINKILPSEDFSLRKMLLNFALVFVALLVIMIITIQRQPRLDKYNCHAFVGAEYHCHNSKELHLPLVEHLTVLERKASYILGKEEVKPKNILAVSNQLEKDFAEIERKFSTQERGDGNLKPEEMIEKLFLEKKRKNRWKSWMERVDGKDLNFFEKLKVIKESFSDFE
jgi:hypothetical protein